MIPLGVVGYGSRICSVISSCLRAVELDLRVIAVVDHGTLSFDWYKNEMKYVRHHEPFTDTIKAGEGLSHFGGDAELASDFIGIIRGTARSRATVAMGIQSVYACLAAKESARTGKFVRVRQVGICEPAGRSSRT